jgi:hypothetical protein
MKVFGFIVLLTALLQCGGDGESETIKCFPMECSTVATVKDLNGLDGCGLIFELLDGTRLEPERRVYVQPPTPEQDPLYYFELKAGEKVQISYIESNDMASVCMVGKVVFITCIKSYKLGLSD